MLVFQFFCFIVSSDTKFDIESKNWVACLLMYNLLHSLMHFFSKHLFTTYSMLAQCVYM